MAFKKSTKEFVLSDSSVNELGFRLLTSGYQLPEFERNPIGFAQHKRDEGVALKWEGLRVDGDKIIGTPVINMNHPRGEQIFEDVENGFLNAASMGYFVFLEMSADPNLMMEGQTLPTITKWYNKECSLVDIPGNFNAYKLFGKDGNEITLASLSSLVNVQNDNSDFLNLNTTFMNEIKLTAESINVLKLSAITDSTGINAAIMSLAARANTAETALETFKNEMLTKEVKALLDAGLEGNKLTVELAASFEKDYATNPAGLKKVLDGMGAYQSVTGTIDAATAKLAAKYEGKDWDQLKEANLMADFKKECPELYKDLYKKTFKKDAPVE